MPDHALGERLSRLHRGDGRKDEVLLRLWALLDTAATCSDSRCLIGQVARGRRPQIPQGLIVHGGD